MLLPQLMRPLPAGSPGAQPGAGILDTSFYTVISGPVGSYLAERLAAAIASRNRWNGCVWLRRPQRTLRSLDAALGEACAKRWNADPHPLDDPRRRLEQALLRSPEGAVVVVEVTDLTTAIGRLMTGLRPLASERGVRLVVVTEGLHLPVLRFAPDTLVTPAALGGRDGLAARIGEAAYAPVAAKRLARLAERRPAVATDLLDAAAVWPSDVLGGALAGRIRTLERVTAALLELCTPAQRSALEASVSTGYWHPQLDTGVVRAADLRPWLVPLEESWSWVRPIWLAPLRRALAARERRGPRSVVAVPAPRPVVRDRSPGRGVVEARLFGGFEVRVDGIAVDFPGRRGRSVLRFLLARPDRRCPRDQLLEEFWPDVDERAARNRLQVAISGLRSALRPATNDHVIEYVADGYRISPAVRVHTDVEEFEDALGAARTAEHRGRPDVALGAYHQAIDLYRGDFAADVPYEPWTLLPRERLRLRYLDALDAAGRISLGAGRIDDCIVTAHRVLEVDPGREDAHRLLMRCYLRQGRTHQALRQYELCRRLLAATLAVEPAPETTALYRSIRPR
ncbi:BTAD domain-containing putative transcriptional regulator [Cryptosporangium arvum]|uniref:BTAD domain-containing putative transcriptional regulator n=1 Tax=Cryptosporangium arvum TaxID=80871 RepID=UPI0004B4252A|nr:BTAD domain-containing putative transcriptional regulator [Cryptosporangium arvum]